MTHMNNALVMTFRGWQHQHWGRVTFLWDLAVKKTKSHMEVTKCLSFGLDNWPARIADLSNYYVGNYPAARCAVLVSVYNKYVVLYSSSAYNLQLTLQ